MVRCGYLPTPFENGIEQNTGDACGTVTMYFCNPGIYPTALLLICNRALCWFTAVGSDTTACSLIGCFRDPTPNVPDPTPFPDKMPKSFSVLSCDLFKCCRKLWSEKFLSQWPSIVVDIFLYDNSYRKRGEGVKNVDKPEIIIDKTPK